MAKMTLEDMRKAITKEQGPGSLMMLGDNEDFDVERIPCGIISVDLALGGGFPRGRICELFGGEGAAKSSMALKLCASTQEQGLKVMYVDMENAINQKAANDYGVDIDSMLLGQPDSGESALEQVNLGVQVEEVGLIVVDSVAAMTPRAEINGDFGDSHVGLQARMMSQGMRKVNSTMMQTDSKAIVLFINQLRENIGNAGFGPKTTTPGGRAVKFFSSVRCEVSRTGQLKKEGDDPHGHSVKVKVVKNRTAPPLRTATFDVLYDRGISNGSAVLDMALASKLVNLKGSWYVTPGGESLGQGRIKAIDEIESNDALREDLTAQITAAYNGE